MEASIANVVSPGEKMLVLLNGQFSERFVAIGKALGAEVDVLEVAWGDAVDPGLVEQRVANTNYRAVVAVHNESSTGIVNDIAGIGAILRNRPTLLIVDSVSALGGLEMRQDEWGVDIVVSASQKALMCPPGVGIVSLSAKALEVVNRDNGSHRFYWDFRKALAAAQKWETPFTAPVTVIAGLEEALVMIHEEGLPQVLARHRRLSNALRVGCAALGLSGFGQVRAHSSTVVVVNVPGNLRGGDIVKGMYERHRAIIAGARNELAGRIIRIGTMGDLNASDILMDLVDLEEVLVHLGWNVAPGAGAAAAAVALRES
jgi:aspartate aminotransferase-like enzyme